MKLFLICPVRNETDDEAREIEAYVSQLERAGHSVHWPKRDTRQDDPVGIAICTQNVQAIKDADAVAVWWSPSTRGGLFDLGAAFALRKMILLANQVEMTEGKSFENVLAALDTQSRQRPDSEQMDLCYVCGQLTINRSGMGKNLCVSCR